MSRYLDFALIACVIGGAVWTYQIKHEADHATRELADLERQIKKTRNHVSLLRADFELLSSPSRLAVISRQHAVDLELWVTQASQIISMGDLPPMKVVAESEADEMTTGNITDLIERLEQRQ